MMWLFPVSIIFLGLLFVWQLWSFVRERGKPHQARMSYIRMVFLLVIIGLLVFGWNRALFRITAFMNILPVYPNATMDVFRTPILRDVPSWSFQTRSTPDDVFNWYRARAKHAGWTVAEEDGFSDRAFVIVTTPRLVTLVLLREKNGKTEIFFTQEIDIHRVEK